jgi:hypothetical protein
MPIEDFCTEVVQRIKARHTQLVQDVRDCDIKYKEAVDQEKNGAINVSEYSVRYTKNKKKAAQGAIPSLQQGIFKILMSPQERQSSFDVKN